MQAVRITIASAHLSAQQCQGCGVDLHKPQSSRLTFKDLMTLKSLLARWPLIQQIKTGASGTGPEAIKVESA